MSDPRPDQAFFRNAILDTVIPEASDPRLPEALDDTDGADSDDDSSLISIRQRDCLYYDEQVTAYVVLRTVNGSIDALKEFLPRIDIELDVHASSASQAEQHASSSSSADQSKPERELIFSDQVKNDRDPFIAVNESAETSDEEGDMILAIWEIRAVLNRPRLRFQSPVVTFTASASLRRAEPSHESSSDEEYLPSLVPAATNILDGLKSIPALKAHPPYLPAARIESVLPGPALDSETLRLRHHPTKRFPISPAVAARVRCSRMNTSSARTTTIASLDFEVTPFANFEVLLSHANISLASAGEVDLLSPLSMPITCRPKDTVTILYKVQPPQNPQGSPLPLPAASNSVGLLDIVLESILQISPTCKPTITMRWRSTVDFSHSIDPRFGPSSQLLQRANRPNSLPLVAPSTTSITKASHSRPTTPPQDTNLTSLTSTTSTTTTTTTPTGSSLTISFTAPPTVPLGKIFAWTLLLTNHSPRPLKLALIPIPHRPAFSTHPQRKHAPKASSSSYTSTLDRRHSLISTTTAHDPTSTAAASVAQQEVGPSVLPEHIILALQKAAVNNQLGAELVPVSVDVRVGPIGAGACHEVGMKLLGLKVGVWGLAAVRVVDLGREGREGREQDVGAGGGVGKGFVDVPGALLPEVEVVDERREGSWRGEGREGESR